MFINVRYFTEFSDVSHHYRMIAVVLSVVRYRYLVVLCLRQLVANISETFTLLEAQQYQTNRGCVSLCYRNTNISA
jgi:hypothetical protein